jgi:hypothetical protein
MPVGSVCFEAGGLRVKTAGGYAEDFDKPSFLWVYIAGKRVTGSLWKA